MNNRQEVIEEDQVTYEMYGNRGVKGRKG